ncbi:MAG: ATP-binding cassette domain-containing protein [Pseudomonadota bacterium]
MAVSLDALEVRHPAATAQAPAALRPLSLAIRPGEQVAVIGPSGAGKTTLLHAIACALKPASGRLLLDGQDPWSLPVRDLQRLRGRLFLAPQVPPLPPRQRTVTALLAARLPTLSFWASLRSLVRPVGAEDAHAALARFDLEDKLWTRVDRLSGGERQRVGLARALLAPAGLWLVDEPLSALDPTRSRLVVETLTGEARTRGTTLLATLHQVDVAIASFPRIIGLRNGELAFDLPSAEVTRDHLLRLYAQFEHELAAAPPVPLDLALPVARPTTVVVCR